MTPKRKLTDKGKIRVLRKALKAVVENRLEAEKAITKDWGKMDGGRLYAFAWGWSKLTCTEWAQEALDKTK